MKTQLLLGAIAILTPSVAFADSGVQSESTAQSAPEADDTGIADIIVTARHRAEPLQSTPLAISAVSPEQMAQSHVTQIQDIKALVPNFNMERAPSNPNALFISLRGFGAISSGPASEPSVSLNIDGIYIGSNFAQTVNLFDVESVEVLRGPQGTLVGKNSPAGAVNIRTRRPKDVLGGMVKVDYGSFDSLQLSGYVDVPVVEGKLATTLSYFRERSDGYVYNTTLKQYVGGLNNQSIRAGFLATPNDSVKWYVTAQYDIGKDGTSTTRNIATLSREEQRIPTAIYAITATNPLGLPPVARICSGPSASICTSPAQPVYTTASNQLPNKNDAKTYNVVSDLSVEGGAISLASITGYRRGTQISPLDVDGTEFTVLHAILTTQDKQFSQELRFSSTDGGGLDLDGRLDWQAGLYYFWYSYSQFQAFTNGTSTGGTTSTTDFQKGSTNSMAIFAHAGLKLSDAFTVSGGVRQTWDDKNHAYQTAAVYAAGGPAVQESKSWKNLSVDASAEWHFAPQQMLYFRYATGYRGGGFNSLPSSPSVAGPYNPETVRSYELGLKSDLFDRRLRINVSAFKSLFSDLQRTLLLPDPNSSSGFSRRTYNAAKATTQGVELELQARPVAGLNLHASVGYLDAKYNSYFGNLTGNAADPSTDNSSIPFALTSKWTTRIGGDYEQDLGGAGTVDLNVDFNTRSDYQTSDLGQAFALQKGYGLLSAGLTWHDTSDHFSLSVYGQNLTNRHYYRLANSPAGLGVIVTDGVPRSWGVSAGVKY